jgi:hypothetical protein
MTVQPRAGRALPRRSAGDIQAGRGKDDTAQVL